LECGGDAAALEWLLESVRLQTFVCCARIGGSLTQAFHEAHGEPPIPSWLPLKKVSATRHRIDIFSTPSRFATSVHGKFFLIIRSRLYNIFIIGIRDFCVAGCSGI